MNGNYTYAVQLSLLICTHTVHDFFKYPCTVWSIYKFTKMALFPMITVLTTLYQLCHIHRWADLFKAYCERFKNMQIRIMAKLSFSCYKKQNIPSTRRTLFTNNINILSCVYIMRSFAIPIVPFFFTAWKIAIYFIQDSHLEWFQAVKKADFWSDGKNMEKKKSREISYRKPEKKSSQDKTYQTEETCAALQFFIHPIAFPARSFLFEAH